ncbi:MAG: hypothetical protein EAZ97_04575 [Bacteroidetes bacterium]|nr:MAG: hypothetical protein EAZ97_04575 [Bacteroidota bacterium]
MKYLIVIYLFFVNFALFAQEKPLILLTDPNETVNLGKYVSFLEDKEGNLSIEQINSPEFQIKFNKSEMATLNFGMITDSYYWIKMEIKNQTFEGDWVLELPYSMFEIANWYKKDNGEWRLHKDGYALPQAEREMQTRLPAIRFNLEKDSTEIIYLKFKANTLACPLHIQNLKNYIVQQRWREMSFGAMQSIIAVIFCICIFLYFNTKKVTYLFFALSTASIFVFSIFYDGYWTAGYVNKQAQLNFISFLLYALAFFKVKDNFPKIYTFGKFILAYLIFSFVVVWFIPSNFGAIWGQINYTFVILPFIVYVIVCSLRQGNKEAKLYILGMSLQFILVMLEVILVNSGIDRPFLNFMHLGFFAEIIVFAFALANQSVNEQTKLQKEKQAARQENERLIREQNQVLEQKVSERTESLQVANEELAVINEELYQTQEEILAQRDALEQHTFQIQKSIEAAQIIQKAILPSKFKMVELFTEYFVLFKPKDIVSGDFWWTDQINESKYLVVADCTGHGVSGAMLTMIGSSLLDRIIQVLKIAEPAQILETLHKEIKISLRQERNKNSEGMDIAIVCWKEKNNACELTFAAAKRPLYYILNNKIEKIAGSRKHVGGLSKSTKSFETHQFSLPKNSTIYLSSDGFADQNDVKRAHFTEKRLIDLLESMQHLTLIEQKIRLKSELNQHMEKTEQRDDILLIGVKI